MSLQAEVKESYLYAHQKDYNLMHKSLLMTLEPDENWVVDVMLTLAYYHYQTGEYNDMMECFEQIDNYLNSIVK